MVWKTAESRETKWAAENIGFVFLYFVWHFLCWKYNRFFNNVHNMLWFINWKMGFPIHMIWFTIWWSRQILLQQIQVVNGVPPTGDYSFAKYNKVNAGSVFTFMPALLTWFNVCLLALMQSVDITRYTDEEYEKYLANPVGIMSRLHV